MKSVLWSPALLGLFMTSAATAEPAPAGAAPAEPRYELGAFVRVRYQQSVVDVVPRLRSRLRSEYPDPVVAAAAEQTVRDTARESDGIYPARADITLSLRPSPKLRGEIRLDFARLLNAEEAPEMVREFYGEFVAAPEFSVTAGVFAAPFSLHEVFEAQTFELAGEGPSHHLLEHLGFYGREVGAMVSIKPLRGDERLKIDLSALDGDAMGGQTYRGPGLLTARITGVPLPYLTMEAGGAFRPRPIEKWWEELRYRYRAYDRGAAVDVNAAFQLSELMLRAEWLMGRRVDNDIPVPLARRRGDARTFMSVFGMATLRIPVGSLVMTPALRGEWLDTDRETADVGQILHFSAGLNVDFDERFRALCELSRHLVQPGTRNWHFDIVRYDTDVTTGTLQLQMSL